MLTVLAVCAAPVLASYVAYFVIRPSGRTNYSELIEPQRPVPDALALSDLSGQPVRSATLLGRWLLVVVSSSECDAACERHLWIQRQLREALGRDKDRVDKVWLITDARAPRAAALQAVTTNTTATVLHVTPPALATWLAPAEGRALSDHLYIVDPLGHWMMRTPVDPDPAKLKRDVEKLLRASAGWDPQAR
jgi:cytochrome oxidase Cu insertion factor (SCO1/SenC/PrrC family)